MIIRKVVVAGAGIVAAVTISSGAALAQSSPPPEVQVLNTVQVRPEVQTLPRTGSDLGAVYVGLGLAGVGTVLVVGARRRRQPTVAS